ncbi:GNAT family N-acetyltransferase [Paraburkholderia sp. BCC1884]|uniref:GNAT family N-acetyltransferase n=1 Tax=Paraburkholderia sp. BCC1884 TaxID=2562668 RepID=UPI001182F83C|nr:GNAT family N-acetyltransferase [Paraburkholderia sp. BCC1884]
MKEATSTAETASENRIVLKACEPADMEAFADIMSLPGVRSGTLSNGYRRTEQIAAWHKRRLEGSVSVCAWLDGRIVGHAGLELYRPSRAHGACLGISVHDDYHGRGVGTALMQALTGSADGSLGLRRIELTVFADNVPAIALYRKFGFVEEGRSRAYAMRDGVLADALHMARLTDAPRFAPI